MSRRLSLILFSIILFFSYCKKEETYSPLIINYTCTNLSHPNDSNGSITLNISGGKPPYTISWFNGANSLTLNNLKVGSYNVSVKDSRNVFANKTINLIIKNDSTLFISYISINPTHPGDTNGSIKLTIAGGNPPYTVNWSTGSSSVNLNNLKDGSYNVTVKDRNNISAYQTIILTLEYELVNINTDFGDILIWLYDETPLHKANFLHLTQTQFYDSLIFHRVIDNFVIQGGDPTGTGNGGPGYDITAEFNDSLTHVMGAVGAARLPDNVNPQKRSNGSQFYIVENETGCHSLDMQYTVFGITVSGINAVHAIADVPTDANNKPLQNVYMKKVEIRYFTSAQLLSQYNFKIPNSTLVNPKIYNVCLCQLPVVRVV